MRKTVCDHCGKEISGVEINELLVDDCFFDNEAKEFVRVGYTLCGKCWAELHQAHINLNMKFLNMVGDGME